MEKTGRLYLIGTPIGNLEDITLRALRVISECDVLFCEDTRVTRKLLARHKLRKKLISLYAESPQSRLMKVSSEIAMGKIVGYVCDAGIPGVSDPGAQLVRLAYSEGFELTVIPGVSAVTTAISYLPVEFSGFGFLGFLGRTKKMWEQVRQVLKESHLPQIIFVAPHDLSKFLHFLSEGSLSKRQVLICRELTKKFEEVKLLSVADALHYASALARGELTLVFLPEPDKHRRDDEKARSLAIDFELAISELKKAGFSAKDIKKILRALLGTTPRQLRIKIYNELDG